MDEDLTAKLNAALAAAQQELVDPKHNKEVDMTLKSGRRVHYTYADLMACMAECRKVLPKHGLSLSQVTQQTEHGLLLITQLRHCDGGVVESSVGVPNNGTLQELGGNITYLKRYQLCAVIGMASDSDVDGEALENDDAKPPRKKPTYETKGPAETPKYTEWPWGWEMKVKGQKYFIGDMTLDQVNWLIDDHAKLKTMNKAQEAGLKALKAAASILKKGGEQQGNAGGATKTAGTTGSTSHGTGTTTKEAQAPHEGNFDDGDDSPF
jgi:hypothetical protein